VFAPMDLEADPRWPTFGTQVTSQLGVRGMIALRLICDVPDAHYGLNLYARQPAAFVADDLLFCLLVGCFASSLVRTSASRDVIMTWRRRWNPTARSA
jgi:hypothetical protein